jgi:CheY-like chemotaxis protein
MPEIDGLTATRLIRQREIATNNPHTPIIGLTAYALQGDKARCLEAGMDDYMSKPFNPETLLEVLGRADI